MHLNTKATLLLSLYTASVITYANTTDEYFMAGFVTIICVIGVLMLTKQKVRDFMSQFF